MPLSDDISHYASIVSWKVKQQTQILHIQARIHELESQIGIQKTILAEQTYDMYIQGAVTEEPIRQICEKITALMAQKAEHQKELEILRSQNPPEKPRSTAAALRTRRQAHRLKLRLHRSSPRQRKRAVTGWSLDNHPPRMFPRSQKNKVGNGWTRIPNRNIKPMNLQWKNNLSL
jgi:hypothetical protein